MTKRRTYCPVSGYFLERRIEGDPWRDVPLVCGEFEAGETIPELVLRDRGLRLKAETAYVLTLGPRGTERAETSTTRRPIPTAVVSYLSDSLKRLGDAEQLFAVDVDRWEADLEGRIYLTRNLLRSAVGSDVLRDHEMLTKIPLLFDVLAKYGVAHGCPSIADLGWRSTDGSLALRNFGVPWLVGCERGAFGRFDGLGRSIGDPRWMAPWVMFGHPPTPESDRYSMAASIILAMPGGRHPLGSGAELLGIKPLQHCMALTASDWLGPVELQFRTLPGVVQEFILDGLNPLPRRGARAPDAAPASRASPGHPGFPADPGRRR